MEGEKKDDVSKRQSFEINVLPSKLLKPTIADSTSSKWTKSLSKATFSKPMNTKSKQVKMIDDETLNTYTSLNDGIHIKNKRNPSDDVHSRSDVMLTLGVALSCTVLITFIAVFIIFVIKQRRQRMLKDIPTYSNKGDCQLIINFPPKPFNLQNWQT